MPRKPSVPSQFPAPAALAAGALLALLAAGSLGAATATLSVDAGALGPSFLPIDVFGLNTPAWTGRSALNTITPRLKAAGTYFFRYPGGNLDDEFHWNGNGSFNAQGHWVPSSSAYSPSWLCAAAFRGSSSGYPAVSMLTDGDPSTRWLSNLETDSPNAQWAYVDLGSSQTADRVEIQWATPYATQFKVQTWNAPAGAYLPFGAPNDLWQDSSAGLLSGSGGTQTVAFSPVTRQFFRVLCLASSASPAQYSIAEIRVLNGAAQVSKNVATITNAIAGGGGANGTPDQSWATASSMDPASTLTQACDLDFEGFMDWLHAYAPQAKPLLSVNMGTGTPQEAAAWVHYANIVRGYGVRDWEVSSEPEWLWECGGPMSAKDYGRRYIQFYEAMKAEDPSIRVYGPVSGSSDLSNDYDGKTFLRAFIDRLAADPGGSKAAYAEGIDLHWYPFFGPGSASEAQLLATPEQLDAYLQGTLPVQLANHPNAAGVPVILTEYNAGLAFPPAMRLCAGLWMADWLGTWISRLGPRALTMAFEAAEPGDANVNVNGCSVGLLNGSSDAYLYQPRAQYWALQMLATAWAQPGDSGSEQLVQASSDQPLLKAYANLRPDGMLSLLVVNKDPANAYDATLSLAGFSPRATAESWTLDASRYAWNTSLGVPYHAEPDLPPLQATDTGVSANYTRSFGPYSLTVIQFRDSSKPVPTPTLTPTSAPTLLPTPTWGAAAPIDSFEDPSRDGPPPARTDYFNGLWNFTLSAGTQSSALYQAPAAAATAYGAAWSLTIPAGGWGNWVAPFSAPFNAVAAGYEGLRFWAYGDGQPWRATIQTQGVTDYDFYGLNFTPVAGTWTLVEIPFSSMTRAGWGTQSPAPPLHPAATDIVGIQFSSQASGVLRLGLDELAFYKTVPATATPTVSPTPTASPSAEAYGGSLDILQALPFPNPVSLNTQPSLRLKLDGKADHIRVQVYTTAYQKTAEWMAPGGGPGWMAVDLTQAAVGANGVYYAVVRSERGGELGELKRVKVLVVR